MSDSQVQIPARLAFLDGLRAIAALAVVAVHAFQIYGFDLHNLLERPSAVPFEDHPADHALQWSYRLVWKWGPYAVPVFIVLSGFSLMLPLMRRTEMLVKGGVWHFYWQRIRRIMPPYYAALGLAMLVTALVPGFNTLRGVYWDLALPTFQLDVILAHLFLIHNLPWASDPVFGMRINPPLWSIAVEMQIYLLFPLLILLWRLVGAWITVGLALLIGIMSTMMGVTILPLSNAHYLGLFALGMLGAFLAFGHPLSTRLARSWWLVLATSGVILFGLAGLIRIPWLSGLWLPDSMLGIAVLGLLVYGSLIERTAGATWPRSLAWLSAPPLVALGERSYSLYLIHAPVLALVAMLFIQLPASLAYTLVFLVGIPACIGATLIFFHLAERPFLNTPPSTSLRVAQPAMTKSHRPIVDRHQS